MIPLCIMNVLKDTTLKYIDMPSPDTDFYVAHGSMGAFTKIIFGGEREQSINQSM